MKYFIAGLVIAATWVIPAAAEAARYWG